MSEYILQLKNLAQLVKLLSGFFSLTKKECQVLAALIHIMNETGESSVTTEVKKQLASFTNFGYQVTTNYIGVFKRKGVVQKDNTLHPILTTDKITIQCKEHFVTKSV